ncbi:uncharacterized protein BO88DRAFT_408227 [Aspergillus vadensis CBS 113365]|uniref:Uncharacterized protein n=1 Tax=Aspergillus vadensis (strain CBS 113365 / IMI 142717 / IBT 24658) TaxID=1448311 RepID=A0A319BMV8_ASPVC|nr:hypothetical protein BO88DRAFT_408227 [Aspergillus vadensis CBS 113365]PYH64578.1 hypothetical protein BO88DRAFT_408227 [Aspergillus vadensis CBS 113365]
MTDPPSTPMNQMNSCFPFLPLAFPLWRITCSIGSSSYLHIPIPAISTHAGSNRS